MYCDLQQGAMVRWLQVMGMRACSRITFCSGMLVTRHVLAAAPKP